MRSSSRQAPLNAIRFSWVRDRTSRACLRMDLVNARRRFFDQRTVTACFLHRAVFRVSFTACVLCEPAVKKWAMPVKVSITPTYEAETHHLPQFRRFSSSKLPKSDSRVVSRAFRDYLPRACLHCGPGSHLQTRMRFRPRQWTMVHPVAAPPSRANGLSTVYHSQPASSLVDNTKSQWRSKWSQLRLQLRRQSARCWMMLKCGEFYYFDHGPLISTIIKPSFSLNRKQKRTNRQHMNLRYPCIRKPAYWVVLIYYLAIPSWVPPRTFHWRRNKWPLSERKHKDKISKCYDRVGIVPRKNLRFLTGFDLIWFGSTRFKMGLFDGSFENKFQPKRHQSSKYVSAVTFAIRSNS